MNVERELRTSNNIIESFIENHKDDPAVNKQISLENQIRMGMNMLTARTGLIEGAFYTAGSPVEAVSESEFHLPQDEPVKEEYKWPYLTAPYFTIPEIIKLNNYYYEQPIQDISLISDLFLETHPGEIKSHSLRSDWGAWHNKVVELMDELKNTDDPDEIARIKQELVNNGWNPEVDYCEANIEKARKRIERIMTEHMNNPASYGISIEETTYDPEAPKDVEVTEPVVPLRPAGAEIIDISEDDDVEEAYTEAKGSRLYPISVVLIDGKSGFSNVIKAFTMGEFSHSAICIDNNFENLYSFNLNNHYNKTGGFSLEKLSGYDPSGRLSIFTFYVPKFLKDAIQARCTFLKNNIAKTTYSIKNILLMPFHGINLNCPTSMICSQFVDSILKMANININKKDSSHVAPNTMYKTFIKNPKVYKVFDGFLKDFNEKKTRNLISRWQNKSYAYNEVTVEELVELKKYASELYYENYQLERTLYANANLDRKDENRKRRAELIKEFRTTVEQIQCNDPEFSFDDYYTQSPFYDDTYEYTVPDLPTMKEILRNILSYE